jgi:hypothetical protein
MGPIRAWYFSDEARRLRYGDGREIAVGVEHTIRGSLKLCKRGLHGSELILDALSYAPSTIVWLVDLSGRLLRGDDKIVATRRKYIAGGVDISDILQQFSRSEALLVADKWNCPEVMRRWLETGDETLRSAARSTAELGVQLSVCPSAESAAWSAIWSTTLAAQPAALSAALAATHSVAWSTIDSIVDSSIDLSSVEAPVLSTMKLVALSVVRSVMRSNTQSTLDSFSRLSVQSAAWLAASRRLEAMVIKALNQV